MCNYSRENFGTVMCLTIGTKRAPEVISASCQFCSQINARVLEIAFAYETATFTKWCVQFEGGKQIHYTA